MADDRPSKTPYAEEWLAFEQASGGRFCCEGTVEEVREQFDAMLVQLKAALPPPDHSVVKEEHSTSEGVVVRVYKPAGVATGLPVGLYIHSGGWSSGSIDAEDHLTRLLSLIVPCILVSVEYRLAPEHPFPAALDDCVSAYRWMSATSSQLGDDSSKLFIVGGSAGGNLSITTAMRLIESDAPADNYLRPRGVYALCPAVCMIGAIRDLPRELRQYQHPDSYEDAANINKSTVEVCGAAYTGSHKPSDALVSPIFHPDLNKLPPMYLTTSNKDPLNDDVFMFQHKLGESGVECTLKEYDGYPHFFHMLPQLEASQRFMADLARAIREEFT